MANIKYKDFEKNRDSKETKKISIGSLDVKNKQYYIKENNVLFDFIEIDFGEEEGLGVEVWMSFLGEEFKMKITIIPKDEFESLNIPEFLVDSMDCFLHCLECKTKFLDGLCDHNHGEDDEEA